ncbi:MAG: helix-turn-helix domain-containing protein [Peptococcaceae bacterium]|nr:helix-turn-helix domain-containing protein [Peptococcaceae bacterium]
MTLETTEDCEIYYIDTRALLHYLVYEEHALDAIWESTYRRMSSMSERILDVSGATNKGQVCKFIYNLAMKSTQTTDSGQIVIKKIPTRNDFAFFIGSHKSNVIKVLKALEKEGVLSFDSNHLIINDIEELKEIIDEAYYVQ